MTRLRLLAPEVVQVGATDCGPAVLTAALRGHGVSADLARIRDRCHTDVDGTAITTLQILAGEEGIDADQVVVPVDHVTRADAGLLPAIAVTLLPDGLAHFVLLWRTVGPFVQVMDPAVGRRWVRERTFRRSLYVHRQAVDAQAWRAYAGSDDHLRILRGVLDDLAVPASHRDGLVAAAEGDPTWRGLARLSAAAQAVAGLVEAGALPKRRAGSALDDLLCRGAPDLDVAERFWPVLPSGSSAHPGQVWLQGAVLVKLPAPGPAHPSVEEARADRGSGSPARPTGPWRRFGGFLEALAPRRLAVALLVAGLAGVSVVAEAVALREVLAPGSTRATGWVVVAVLAAALLAVASECLLLRLGRQAELTLRTGVARRFGSVADRFVATRPRSDLVDRAHGLQRIADVPERLGAAVTAGAQAAGAMLAVLVLLPHAWPGVLALVLVPTALTALAQPGAVERELRVRNLAGSLGQSLLDALDGLPTLRAHRARPALTYQADAYLASWQAAVRSRDRWMAGSAALARATGLVAAGLVLVSVAHSDLSLDGALLVGFLAVLAAFGLDAAAAALRSLPAGFASAERLIDLLEAPQEPSATGSLGAGDGVALELRGVGVDVAGTSLLTEVDLRVEPGQHVAIVGASGAGKSTLVSVLLGLVDPSCGSVEVDGTPLGQVRQALREATAWIDPGAAIWNRSVRANIAYGQPGLAEADVVDAGRAAGLGAVVAQRADGWDAAAGYEGGYLSGGEGERLRIARAWARPEVRLVVGDEALRGLHRDARRELLDRCRARWCEATILWSTHDVTDAASFDLVVVVEGGRVVEVGRPEHLGPGSAYARLVEAEQRVSDEGWAASGWRVVEVDDARLRSVAEASPPDPVEGSDPDPCSSTAVHPPDAGGAAARVWRAAIDRGDRVAPVAGGARGRARARRRSRVVVLGADGREVELAPGDPEPRRDPGADAPLSAATADLPVRPRRRLRAAAVLAGRAEQDEPAWRLRPRETTTWRELWRSGVAAAVLAGAVLAAVFVAGTTYGFAVVGQVALNRDGWMVEWALAALVAVVGLAAHLVATGAGASGAGVVIRRRLLDAACEADEDGETAGGPDRMAMALEVDALDRAAVGAALFTVHGVLELGAGVAVLVLAGAGPALVALLLVAVAAAWWAGARLVRAQAAAAQVRRSLSSSLAEAILGHRTRLVQGSPAHDEHGDPDGLASYGLARRSVDRWTAVIAAVIPGAWRVAGLVLVVVIGSAADSARSSTQLAALLGGVLLAAAGLESIGSGGRAAAEGFVVARSLGPRLSVRSDEIPQPDPETQSARIAHPDPSPPAHRPVDPRLLVQLVDADLDVGVGAGQRRILQGVTLGVHQGDRVLLTGPSGAGKSTLLRAMAGLHPLAAGEREVLGAPRGPEGSELRIVATPQFHRNHVFLGTVAFNVLMGRGWPATGDDVDDAEALCRDLGLGPLIDRMPSGMNQAVGEMGWRLSHGERSRIFVARALAQRPDVLLLDESLGALDPVTLRTCVAAIEARCPTIVLVAHP